MSNKAIEILKSKMSLEERQEFVNESTLRHGEKFYQEFDGRNLYHIFQYRWLTFDWDKTKKGRDYWESIFNRFTYEELNIEIKLKEFKI
jgi:hypothetical protein